MRILHTISQRPDSTGSGIYLQALLKGSAAQNHHNHLLAGQPPLPETTLIGVGSADVTYVGFTNNLSDQQCIIGMSDIMPYTSRKFRDLDQTALEQYVDMLGRGVERSIEKARPDLIHSHHLWLLTAYLKDRYPDIPLVVNCHGSDIRQIEQCPWIYRYLKTQCERVDRVFALGEFQKSQILQFYQIPASKVISVGAGFDETIFHTGGRTGDSRQKIHITYGGKISRAKGLPWLLSAFKSLPVEQFHLHLVGGGNGQEFEQMINQVKTLENVTYHGILSQVAFATVLRESAIFILPSLHEGLPLVLLEALACGCRVIATDLPGVSEIISRTDESIISTIPLPEVTDTDESLIDDDHVFIAHIKDSIIACTDQPPLPLTTEELISETFSWPAVIANIEHEWNVLVNA